MANHKSSIKRIRQTNTKKLANRYYAKTARNAVRKLRATTEKAAAVELLPKVSSMLNKLAKKNVTANCIAPGFIETEMTAKLPDIVKDAAKEVIPMKKMGSVKDIAIAIAFLASDDAGYITGQVLCVDGGMSM